MEYSRPCRIADETRCLKATVDNAESVLSMEKGYWPSHELEMRRIAAAEETRGGVVVVTMKPRGCTHMSLLMTVLTNCRCALELPRVANLEERELKRKEWWDGIHELNR